ncbi:hypothetical protein X735_30700 [Mesorhizobium sp. L2C085B000]|nr:hypothetical protein X735_30700 [Mesorhizobium sp. L2C085B000]
MPSTDAAVYMPALAHEVEEGLDIFLGYQIVNIDHDGTASWLQIKRDCRGVEFLQWIGLGLAALAKRKQKTGCSDQQQGSSGALQCPGQGVVLGHRPPDPAAGRDAAVYQCIVDRDCAPYDPARARQLHAHANPDQAVTQPAPPKASAIAATPIEVVSARESEHAAQATQESLISRSCDKLRLNRPLERPAKTAPVPKPAMSAP